MGGLLAVLQNGSPNMSVNVVSGHALIPGSEGSKQGVYSVTNDATVNVAITASDPSNPRIDLVVLKVQDSAYSGATNAASIVAVTGTPAGSPSAPAPPVNAVILAQIAVAASATSIVTGNITDRRQMVAATGGMIRCTSSTRPTTNSVTEGQLIYESDTDRVLFTTDNGTSWTRVLSELNGPRGVVGGIRKVSGTPVSGISSTESLTNLDTGNISLAANRRYHLYARFQVISTTNNDTYVFNIRETNISGAVVTSVAWTNPNSSFGYIMQIQGETITTSAVTKNYVLTGQRVGGSGTVSIIAPLYIVIEDVGPSGTVATLP